MKITDKNNTDETGSIIYAEMTKDLIVGQPNIDLMKTKIYSLVNGLLGLASEYPELIIIREFECEEIVSDHLVWSIFEDDGKVAIECYWKFTHETIFSANFHPDKKLKLPFVEVVYDDLKTFVKLFFETLPQLIEKAKPIIEAAKKQL